MALYPTFSPTYLAEFSGRPESEYQNTAYVDTALKQAVLLFKLGTCLGDNWPDDPVQAELARMAILAMADGIYLSQPFQKILSNPFSSETIGSYSYTKVAGAVLTGLPTGISWFDLAVSQLSVCSLTDGVSYGGGIQVFEDDGYFTKGRGGNVDFLSPADLDNLTSWGFDPSEGYRQ